MIPGRRGLVLLAALTGFSGVVLAALGAHAVDGLDDLVRYRAWQSASLLHLLHAAALLGLAALAPTRPDSRIDIGAARWWGCAGLSMALGVALFSGSIYFSIMAGRPVSGGVAPFGGVLLMSGWLVAGVAAIAERWRSAGT